MIRIVAVRHGETDWNRVRRLQGHTDIPLNANGVAQAERLAVALTGHRQPEQLASIHVSDLSRALATASPVAQALGLTIRRDARLRERNYGVLEGQTFPEILDALPGEAEALRTRDPHHIIPGGESQHMFHRRVVTAFSAIAVAEEQALAARQPGAVATILVVTHGGVLDMLYRTAFGIPLEAERTCAIPNAVINRLTFDRGHFRVDTWDEMA